MGLKHKKQIVPPHYHKGAQVQNSNAESDPVFVAHPAFGLNSADVTDIKNLSGTNTGDQDLSDYVKGPTSAVDGQEALYDGATGKLIRGGSLSIFKTPCSAIDVASTDYVDLFSTSAVLAAKETIYIQALIWLYNRSGAARQYYWALDIGGSYAYLDSRGTIDVCSTDTEGVFVPVEFWISVDTTSLTWVVGRMNHGVAVELASTQTNYSNNGVEVTKISADLTGSKTIKLQMKSASATTTQTATLINWRLEKRKDRG